ncbi:glutamine amidotransferase [Actinopolyspora lacussalsi subsp. righensis]|uniref:Gamma-glutamyl-hercynylcysteine sulfoxide hydrolase n=1 Tax=Actinopolyspora righensis TaxID=995060 RepID=A0A1I7BH59_9ACTN|nr:ergothioneine biosynthesis protein EgtC [Actinopolyspora righensis]SFT86451.1 glutamine amidotransferase [Actinopolyspora righensis]
MCRHVGYLGPPVRLDELLLRPSHGLLEQTWAPNDMRRGGTINVDGFGVGWYGAERVEPSRYRAAGPMWADENFAALAPEVSADSLVGAIRSATRSTSAERTACAPFQSGRWLFSHNGSVPGWPDSLAELAEKLDPVRLLASEAPVDSAAVWALLSQRLSDGQAPADAVRDTLVEVVRAVPDARMNMLLSDGNLLIATTWTHSLSVCRTDSAVVIASEPFELPAAARGHRDGSATADSPWHAVPDGHLVVADREETSLTPLPDIELRDSPTTESR